VETLRRNGYVALDLISDLWIIGHLYHKSCIEGSEVMGIRCLFVVQLKLFDKGRTRSKLYISKQQKTE